MKHLSRLSSRELIASQVVAHVLASLPANLRDEAEQCVIELCLDSSCVEEQADTDLLGLFLGNARGHPPQSLDELPRIQLFLDHLWDFAEGEVPMYRAEVRTTLLHELGHFLGLNEDEVEALGLA